MSQAINASNSPSQEKPTTPCCDTDCLPVGVFGVFRAIMSRRGMGLFPLHQPATLILFTQKRPFWDILLATTSRLGLHSVQTPFFQTTVWIAKHFPGWDSTPTMSMETLESSAVASRQTSWTFTYWSHASPDTAPAVLRYGDVISNTMDRLGHTHWECLEVPFSS